MTVAPLDMLDTPQAEQAEARPRVVRARTRPVREHLYASFFVLWSGTCGLGWWPPSGWDAYEELIHITGIGTELGGWLRVASGAVGVSVYLLSWFIDLRAGIRLLSLLPTFVCCGILTVGFVLSGQGFAIACWSFWVAMCLGIALYEGYRATT